MYQNELNHYGVKGMKWGVHKAMSGVYQTNANFYRKKNRNNTLASMNQVEANRHSKAADQLKREIYAEKAAKMKQRMEKREYKTAKREAYKNVKASTSTAEKLVFNNATRKKAAKYMVDNNMSMTDAKKKANKEAIRNTAAFVGVIGAMTVAELYRLGKN